MKFWTYLTILALLVKAKMDKSKICSLIESKDKCNDIPNCMYVHLQFPKNGNAHFNISPYFCFEKSYVINMLKFEIYFEKSSEKNVQDLIDDAFMNYKFTTLEKLPRSLIAEIYQKFGRMKKLVTLETLTYIE